MREVHIERVPIDRLGFSVGVCLFAFVSDEDETGVAEVNGIDVSDGDDFSLHHIHDLGASGSREMDTGVPRLIGADGIPAACPFPGKGRQIEKSVGNIALDSLYKMC